MSVDPSNPDARHMLQVALQQGLQDLSVEDMRSLRAAVPDILENFVTSATFRGTSATQLHQAAAKWPMLERVTLHSVDPQTDNLTLIEALTSASLPQLADLTLHGFGRTDPALEVAALAAGQWPKLRHLTLCIVSPALWMGGVDPGERWTRAIAALSSTNWKVESVHLMHEPTETDRGLEPVSFPLTDIARCFPLTLRKLCWGYPMEQHAAAALIAAPLPAPRVTDLQLWGCRKAPLDAVAAKGTPWSSVNSFNAVDCVLAGDGAGLGTALPAVTDLWISFNQNKPFWNVGHTMLRSLEGTGVRKIILKWAPVGVLQGAAGMRLPELRCMSLRYTNLPKLGHFDAAEEAMNALLQADLPALENLAVSFGPGQGVSSAETPCWQEWKSVPCLPGTPWPSLKSFTLQGLIVSHSAANFLRRQILTRVPKVKISPEPTEWIDV